MEAHATSWMANARARATGLVLHVKSRTNVPVSCATTEELATRRQANVLARKTSLEKLVAHL